MKVLVTGAHGQVGRQIVSTAPKHVTVYAFSHAQFDVTNVAAVHQKIRELAPDIVINAAAYTAVDQAERDSTQAARINADAPRFLASALAGTPGARLLQISTDFVFDGESSTPYTTDATPNPLSAYGRTKLAAEQSVLAILPERSLILRTAWVYSPHGRNFLLTMLRLMKETGAVRVVSDQKGTPTSARTLAQAIWRCAEKADLCGIYHWTDAGVASWYEFASAIAEEAFAMGLLPHKSEVLPIGTSEYPTAARRPRYSVLDTSATVSVLGRQPDSWRESLKNVLGELARA